MFRTALGALFTSLFVALTVPVATAADTGTTTAKKTTTKKKTVAKSHRKTKQVVKSSANRGMISASLDSRGRTTYSAQGRRKAGYQRVAYSPVVPAPLTAGDLAGLKRTPDPLTLNSNVALVMDQATTEPLFEKNGNVALPIASITKLMTSLVVVEANQNLDEILTVTEEDVDREKFSHFRLRVGSQLTRADMLHIALMSSENRAASALGRHYPGGLPAFVAAMNAKAKALGMTNARFSDSTGLSSSNVASARDLAKLVVAAYQHPLIRQYSTDAQYAVEPGGPSLQYKNSNHLVLNPDWAIGLQKTGYISEAGRCLVMQATIEGRPVVMVFLDSKGKLARTADAGRIRKWLETNKPSVMARTTAQQS